MTTQETQEWRFDGDLFVVTNGAQTLYNIQDAWEAAIKPLQSQLTAKEQELGAAKEERDKEIAVIETLQNLITGYSWLAEGRGPYTYDDGRYDDEVMFVFRQLLEAAPHIRNEPYQSFLDERWRLKGKLTTAEERARRAEAKAALADELAKNYRTPNPITAIALLERINLKDWIARYDALQPARTEGE